MKQLNQKAFTLVELAIVIVIIGLLVGGVLQGQELIEQARQRAMMSQFNGYMAAIGTFQSKYNGLPGDIRKGFVYFGGDDCLDTTVSVSNNGCNGDGDGKYAYRTEGLLFWKHLGKAKMIKGSYTGVLTGELGSGNCCLKAGENVPPSSYFDSVWWIRATDESSMSSLSDEVKAYVSQRNHFHLGAMNSADVDNWPTTSIPVLSAYELDLKYDDGLPGAGNIIGRSLNGCTLPEMLEYRVSFKNGKCGMIFIWNAFQ
jgi:prepilin-type N-terminal cleavage/methylation domain-containing protein